MHNSFHVYFRYLDYTSVDIVELDFVLANGPRSFPAEWQLAERWAEAIDLTMVFILLSKP